jgi:hypothetical protein
MTATRRRQAGHIRGMAMANLVKVYSWSIYDAVTGQHKPAAYPGTLEAIKAANGVPKMETERFISSDWLDENGFYQPKKSDS